VYIRGGTYYEGMIMPRNSGTASSWITYQAYPGEAVWIDGGAYTFSGRSAIMQIGDNGAGKQYIKVSGLGFKNALGSTWACGIMTIESSNILIQGNSFYNIASAGVDILRGSSITVDNNSLELCQRTLDGNGTGAKEEEVLSVSGTAGFQVSNNVVFNAPGDSGGIGIDVRDGCSNGIIFGNTVYEIRSGGIYVDAHEIYTHDIEVYNNIVYNNGGPGEPGIELGSEHGAILENVNVHDNTVYSNAIHGIALSSYTASGYTAQIVRNITIQNNNVYNNGVTFGGGIGIWRIYVENITVKNNIVSNNNQYQIAYDKTIPSGQLVISGNTITGYRGWSSGNGVEYNPGS
jgi:hypothetical protein